MHSRYKRRKRVVRIVVPTEVDIKEELDMDMGVVTTMDMVEEAVDPPHVSIAVRLVMSHDFALNRMSFMHIVIVLNM
jgi:hypothetical protein